MKAFAVPVILAFTVCCGLAGCGSSDLAPVKGQVTFNGQPVKGGMVMFAPVADDSGKSMPGKPAIGQVGEDGVFELTTYETHDGAHLGTHDVTYVPPDPEDLADEAAKAGKPAPKRRLPLQTPPNTKKEIVSGPNEINLKLVINRPTSRGQLADDDD